MIVMCFPSPLEYRVETHLPILSRVVVDIVAQVLCTVSIAVPPGLYVFLTFLLVVLVTSR